MEDLPNSWISRINVIQTATLSKAVYRFNKIPIRIPMQFSSDLERTIINFTWRKKKQVLTKQSQNKNKNKKKPTPAGVTIPNFKLYYRAMKNT